MDEKILNDKTKTFLLLFKQKKYKTAIEEISAAIDKLNELTNEDIASARLKQGLTASSTIGLPHHPKLPTLYDYRFQAYVKLEQLADAYKDAKTILSLQPYGVKGYLRCGKIAQLAGNQTKAYKIYSKGIEVIENAKKTENINISSKLFSQLQTQKNVLESVNNTNKRPRTEPGEILSTSKRKKLVSPQTNVPIIKELRKKFTKSFDPLICFPIEITKQIFSYIDPYEIIQSSFLVCKLWRRILSQIPEYYQNIQFLHPLSPKTFNCFHSFIKRAHQFGFSKKLSSLRIRKIASPNEHYVLRKLMEDELQYETLNLNIFDLDLFQFLEIIENCERSDKLKALKSLNLAIATTPFAEEKVLQLLPRLESLQLVFINGHNNESDMKIKLKSLYEAKVLKFYEKSSSNLGFSPYYNLKTLNLIGNEKLTYSNLKIPLNNVFKNQRLPNLEKLMIVGFNFKNIVLEAESHRLAENYSRRQRRDLDNIVITRCTFRSIFEFPKLTHLYLEGNTHLLLVHFLAHRNATNMASKNLVELTFRETASRNVSTFDSSTFSVFSESNFSHINHLDLYGTSLTFTDLMIILSSIGKQLKYLNIGNPSNLSFSSEMHFSRPVADSVIQFEPFLQTVPNLTTLCLANTGLNSHSLMLFKKSLFSLRQNDSFKNCMLHLKELDLSFNLFNGSDLMQFFNYKREKQQISVGSSMRSKLKIRSSQNDSNTLTPPPSFSTNINSGVPLQLDILVVDGMEQIWPHTAKALVSEEYIGNISCDSNRGKWRQYGKNSYLLT